MAISKRKLSKYIPWLYMILILVGFLLIAWMIWNSASTCSETCKHCGCGKMQCNCGMGGTCACGKPQCKSCQMQAHNHKEGMTGSNTLNNWTDFVDVIYYINLDKREDRNKEFLDEMDRMGVPPEKIVRISAVYKPNQGDWGCSLSHIHAIQSFIQSGKNNCIVFEDDYEFSVDNQGDVTRMFQSLVDNQVDYDMIMLSGNEVRVEQCKYPNLKRVYDAQTTSGYMVNSLFANTLLQNYQEGAQLIEKSYITQGKGENIQQPYCIDQYWKKLQPNSKWYIFSPKLGKQRSSVSDIQGGFVDMTV